MPIEFNCSHCDQLLRVPDGRGGQRARCPQCKKQWEWTSCIPYAGGCSSRSPHLDWYHGLDEWLEEELSEIKVEVLEE